jgi:hypothetical protein
MFEFPDTDKKLKSMISKYKSALNLEKKNHGNIDDGIGRRYVLFWLYFALDDLDKSREYFKWYKKEFTDDTGEPIQKLCWAVSLHRMKNNNEAKSVLADLMLSNLYLIPKIIGIDVQKYDMWHSSNLEDISYVEEIPKQVRDRIKDSGIQWMNELYHSVEFRRVRELYFEIFKKLQHTKEIEKRRKLLTESYALLDSLQSKTS